jgi:nitrate reductase delta subunit
MTFEGPFRKKRPEAADQTRRLKEAVREHFRLAPDDTIMITELDCQVPGCPPLETVIAFWCADDQRRHLKVFKPLADVSAADLPPWWMKDAMIYDDEVRCSCC